MSFLPFSKPSLGAEELESVRAVFESGWITTGPKNSELEQAFCQLTGNKYAVALSSATAGMHLALMALGIKSGDEVITPSMTWVSTLNMIELLGATPKMIDIDPDTLMVTPETIEAAINPRTKAIIPVHYAGASFDLAAINKIADKYNIPIIQDAAHAIGTHYAGQQIGHSGTAIFSLHAIKNITCAEGGILVTDNESLANTVRSLKFHGLGLDAYDRETKGRKAQAEVITPGFKYNLPDINAAIALCQLQRLDKINARRTELANFYLDGLSTLPFSPLVQPSWSFKHAWHLFIIRVDEQRCGFNRDSLMQQLKERNIGTGLHFRAAHTHHYYRNRYPNVSLPNSEWNSSRICSLPLFPDMQDEDVQRVVDTLKELSGFR